MFGQLPNPKGGHAKRLFVFFFFIHETSSSTDAIQHSKLQKERRWEPQPCHKGPSEGFSFVSHLHLHVPCLRAPFSHQRPCCLCLGSDLGLFFPLKSPPRPPKRAPHPLAWSRRVPHANLSSLLRAKAWPTPCQWDFCHGAERGWTQPKPPAEVFFSRRQHNSPPCCPQQPVLGEQHVKRDGDTGGERWHGALGVPGGTEALLCGNQLRAGAGGRGTELGKTRGALWGGSAGIPAEPAAGREPGHGSREDDAAAARFQELC